ncbi:MAG: hypothetical protein Q9204_007378, partial [Flavoplaca sp. TL-2023a]
CYEYKKSSTSYTIENPGQQVAISLSWLAAALLLLLTLFTSPPAWLPLFQYLLTTSQKAAIAIKAGLQRIPAEKQPAPYAVGLSSGDTAQMPFHIDYSPLGFGFFDYECPISNFRVDSILQQAMSPVAAAPRETRSLEYKPMTSEGLVKWALAVDEMPLWIEPRLMWTDLYDAFALLRVWAYE